MIKTLIWKDHWEMVEEKKKKDWERGEGSGIEEDLVEMEGGSPEQQR